MDQKWEFLLSEFRKLGGIADNVYQKEGEFGRGIFPVNPNHISKIYIPFSLMVKKEDIYLEGKHIRIKKNKQYNKAIRNFFNYYQDNFSWGGGGKENVEFFEKQLYSFTPKLKQLINNNILVDIKHRHRGSWDEIIFREFLKARAFKFKNMSMICPILELVNHEVISLSFIVEKDGISTPNYPPISGELTHNYNNESSINRFFYQGFFCKETIVFSFPFSIKIPELGIDFSSEGRVLSNDSLIMDRSLNKIKIKGLPIADFNQPGMPKKYLHQILSRIGKVKNLNHIYTKILKYNILIRRNMLEESKSIDNEVAKMFSEIMDYEINLISISD